MGQPTILPRFSAHIVQALPLFIKFVVAQVGNSRGAFFVLRESCPHFIKKKGFMLHCSCLLLGMGEHVHVLPTGKEQPA